MFLKAGHPLRLDKVERRQNLSLCKKIRICTTKLQLQIIIWVCMYQGITC